MRKKFKGFLATAAGGFAALLATSLCVSCASNEEHFISDASYRSMVEKDFEAKRALMDKGNLFTVFDQQITTQ